MLLKYFITLHKQLQQLTDSTYILSNWFEFEKVMVSAEKPIFHVFSFLFLDAILTFHMQFFTVRCRNSTNPITGCYSLKEEVVPLHSRVSMRCFFYFIFPTKVVQGGPTCEPIMSDQDLQGCVEMGSESWFMWSAWKYILWKNC